MDPSALKDTEFGRLTNISKTSASIVTATRRLLQTRFYHLLPKVRGRNVFASVCACARVCVCDLMSNLLLTLAESYPWMYIN